MFGSQLIMQVNTVIGYKVLVELIKEEVETLSSGIIVPTAKNKPASKGCVLQVGTGKVLTNGRVVPVSGVNVGDVVLWGEYSDKPISGTNMAIVGVDDIYAVVEE